MTIFLTKLRNIRTPRINALSSQVKMEWINLWNSIKSENGYSFKITEPARNFFAIYLYKNSKLVSKLKFNYVSPHGVFVIEAEISQILITEKIKEIELAENLIEILETFIIESFKY